MVQATKESIPNIRGSFVLVDPLKLGLTISVFVHVSLKQQDKESLAIFTKAIEHRPEIMKCLTQISCVASIRSSFALDRVKYTTALPTGHLR